MVDQVFEPGLSPSAPGTMFGHPRGLSVLFMTEMWERFSYYGMRALLVLYMVKFLLLPDHVGHVLGFAAFRSILEGVFGPLDVQQTASQVYGLYTAFVFLTPVFGGMLADRWLGQRWTVIVGALLMAAGHFLMAFQPLFMVAMLLLILGVGLFKPNTTAQVGGLYAPGDPRRDRGYSVFYVGINLGAFLAPLVCGSLGENVGWHWGFGAAGIGMLISTVIYISGLKYLPPDAHSRAVASHTEKQKLTGREWRTIWAIVGVCVLNVFFWATYEQQGNTVALWSDENVNRSLGIFGLDMDFPTTWVQSINPFFIFTLTPLLTSAWARQAAKGREPSSVTKMAIGCALAALSHLVLVLAVVLAGPGGKAHWLWLVVYFFFLTIGELYLSPIGLSLVSKAAPTRIVSLMMGIWFLATFAGNYMAGWLGTFWEIIPHAEFFALMAAIAGAAAVTIMLISRPMQRMISG